MSEKRRRSRIQGGWASTNSNKQDTRQRTKNTTDFQFQPNKQIRKVPDKIIYKDDGDFDISTSENGPSSLIIRHNYYNEDECEWIYEQLLEETPWQQEYLTIKGEKVPQPRLCTWFGDRSYSYSSITLTPYKFSPTILMLKERIEKEFGGSYNSVLVNLYRNEKDSVDWHSDDESSLGKNPEIASLSFGATRTFEMRKIPEGTKGKKKDEVDYTYAQQLQIPVSSGTLVIMKGASQTDWHHRIPKDYHDREPRINLTFRFILPQDDDV